MSCDNASLTRQALESIDLQLRNCRAVLVATFDGLHYKLSLGVATNELQTRADGKRASAEQVSPPARI